jgi:tetratricopeptide (TPR) repeat protein
LKQESKLSSKPIDPAKEQVLVFEKATAAFHKKDFAHARSLFAQAAAGPAAELAHSAQMYVKMCERRMGEGAAQAQSPEELYTLGISLLNRGDVEGAQAALEKALQKRPDTDHYHYALALCAGQKGDMASAASHLRRAIELQPSNRIAALNDADFHAIAQHASIRELLNGERNNAG